MCAVFTPGNPIRDHGGVVSTSEFKVTHVVHRGVGAFVYTAHDSSLVYPYRGRHVDQIIKRTYTVRGIRQSHKCGPRSGVPGRRGLYAFYILSGGDNDEIFVCEFCIYVLPT